MPIHQDIRAYNDSQSPNDKRICDALAKAIDQHLAAAQSKIWHAHPVWFLDGNPIVGYSKLKNSVRLMFWSGQSFDEPRLAAEGTFKAAEARYNSADQIVAKDLKRWLKKAIEIQWDYKNIVKRQGKLEPLSVPSVTSAATKSSSRKAKSEKLNEQALKSPVRSAVAFNTTEGDSARAVRTRKPKKGE